jgi:DNA repair protein RadD
MLFDHLNLAYLGKFGKGFYQIQALSNKREGQIWTDQHILAKCFEANADRSIFQNHSDLIEFIQALDAGTQAKLRSHLVNTPERSSVRELQIGLEMLGLPEEFLYSSTSVPPVISERFYAPAPIAPELYDYQKEIFEEAIGYLEPPYGRCIIQMPTGAGKTRTALQVVFSFLNQGKSVLWLANSQELIEQCLNSFDELWPHQCHRASWVINHLNNPSPPDGEKEIAFHLSTIQSIARHNDGRVNLFKSYGHEISLVVIDEAHISIAPRYKNALESFCMNQSRRMLGLSATPGRGAERDEENEQLAAFFHENLVKLTPPPPHESPLAFLQQEGVLSRPIFVPLEFEWAEELYAKFIEENGENASDQELEQWLGDNQSRNNLILDSLTKFCHQGKQIIYFGTSVQQSELIATMLRLLGIASASISSNTKGRRSLIAQFKNKQLQVLCNYGVLSTGFDAPQTNVVFIARPTSSVILYHQMIGRGLRGPKCGGSETCEIVSILDNIEGLVTSNDILNYFDGYFDVCV